MDRVSRGDSREISKRSRKREAGNDSSLKKDGRQVLNNDLENSDMKNRDAKRKHAPSISQVSQQSILCLKCMGHLHSQTIHL